MTSAQQLMEQLQREGASRFADTHLAHDHGAVVGTVRRQRATRVAVLSVAGVAVAGAAAFGVTQYDTTTVTPGTTPTTPSDIATEPPAIVTLSIAKEQPIEKVARALATAVETTEEDAYEAITAALPPEAGGYGEGWVLAGEYTLDPADGITANAKQLVGTTIGHLESLGVPREKWIDTVVLASIAQREAPAAYADQTAVTRVILNRLELDMPLQIDSALLYALRIDSQFTSERDRDTDSPYNVYKYTGLPPSAIGSFTPQALEAAANPADGDWLYFVRMLDGNVVLSTTYPEHLEAVKQLQEDYRELED